MSDDKRWDEALGVARGRTSTWADRQVAGLCQTAFVEGVRWADDNPQPTTITDGLAELRVLPAHMKMLGEALRTAESLLMDNPHHRSYAVHMSRLIAQVDQHRPTGPDGKHGDRHTSTCGCEDKP